MIEAFHTALAYLNRYEFVLVASIVALLVKATIFLYTFQHKNSSKVSHISFASLHVIIIGAISSDIAWILQSLRCINFLSPSHAVVVGIARLAWAFAVLQYHAISIFLESLVSRKYKLPWYQKSFAIPTCILCLSFIGLCLFAPNLSLQERSFIDFPLFKISMFYNFLVLIPSGFTLFHFFYNQKMPKILQVQIQLLLGVALGPTILLDALQIITLTPLKQALAAAGFGSLFIAITLAIAARKIMRLRFLNFTDHVSHTVVWQSNTLDAYKEELLQLRSVTSPENYLFIVRNFFTQAIQINASKVRFTFRPLGSHETSSATYRDYIADPTNAAVERFVNTYPRHSTVAHSLHTRGILITDEVEFDAFYEHTEIDAAFAALLHETNSDLFIPIYDNHQLMAFITVERHARPDRLYTNRERDQLLVFAHHVALSVEALRAGNQYESLAINKSLRDELYEKHHIIHRYRETLHAVLNSAPNYKTHAALVVYRHGKIVRLNKTANQLLPADDNIIAWSNNTLVKSIRRLAGHAEVTGTVQEAITPADNNKEYMLTAVPFIKDEGAAVIITPPNPAHAALARITTLQDPSEWDYLMYLETTPSGTLINRLIPGHAPILTSYKIELLKIALSKRAPILNIPERDIDAIINVIHAASLRHTLHTVELISESSEDILVKLFGINSLFNNHAEAPLLETLHQTGTICIKNIECLSLAAQEKLANYLQYGFFTRHKSDYRIFSDVRILCTTHHDLTQLVQNGKIHPDLYSTVGEKAIQMPSLNSLSDAEYIAIAHAYIQNTITDPLAKKILRLSPPEERKLLQARPGSLAALQEYIRMIITKKNSDQQTTLTAPPAKRPSFDTSELINDPELRLAARLGKQALKDDQLFKTLWYKFQNQTKIALFLGVNRSTVSRKCKNLNLT